METTTEDPLYEKAKMVVRNTDNPICVAKIQRTLLIGYNRANRLMEKMIADGFVERYDTYSGTGYRLVSRSAPVHGVGHMQGRGAA